MNKELISVIIPAYNAEKYISSAINSVLGQTYNNIEIIVIDDRSDDDTYKIAKEYQDNDSRVIVLRNEQNSGVANTRNRGIAYSSGSYIALLDSDDLWQEDKLEQQLELMRKHNADIVYCSYDFINEDGKPVGKPFIVPESTDFNSMLVKSVISCSTVMAKASLFKNYLFDSRFYHEDYALWMKLLNDGFSAVGERRVLAHYRLLSNSRSSNKLNAAKERMRINREYLNLPLYKRIYATVGYVINSVIKYFL